MLSRRSFLIASACGIAIAPKVMSAISAEPLSALWPTIQGPGADPQRTRVIDSRGIRTQPGELIQQRDDLAFVRSQEINPAMAMTNGILLARAMGPEFPLIGIDATTGDYLWQRERVLSILGVSGKYVFCVVAPESRNAMSVLKAVDVEGPTDVWATGEYDVVGAVIVDDRSLVYSRSYEEMNELVARGTRSGKILWTRDITDEVEYIPAVFATNSDIVVGVNDPSYTSTVISAWSMETGDLVWQHASPGFISSPAFRDGDVVIATVEGIQIISTATGEVTNEIQLSRYEGGLVKLAFTDDVLILQDAARLHAINWDSGDVLWSRSLRQSGGTSELFICDGMALRLEDATETSIYQRAVRGYDLADGQLIFEFLPQDADGEDLYAAAFLVGNGHLYAATNLGICTWLPGENAIEEISDPAISHEIVNDEFGFSYTWSEDWEAIGATHLTPNGQIFEHRTLGCFVAQSAGEPGDSDRDFARSWHAVLGPGDTLIEDIHPVKAPDLDFIPADAEVLGVVYRTTLQPPSDLCFGLRVLMPLADGQRLVFEYFQLDVRFEDKINAFATFFENLELM